MPLKTREKMAKMVKMGFAVKNTANKRV